MSDKHELPSPVQVVDLPQQKQFDGEPFPLALAWPEWGDGDDVAAYGWASQHRQELDHLLKRHGALLFRGFGLRSADDFDRFVRAFDYPNFAYADSLSNAVRVNLSERVFTANEAPPSVTISLHHEMAQTPIYPSRLFFFCEASPPVGGATPLCRSDKLFEAMQQEMPAFAEACEQKGLRYSHVMPPENDPASGLGRSWRSTLGVETAEAAEQRLRKLGYDWQWLEDGSLRVTTPVLPAVRELSSPDGAGTNEAVRKSFFNQLIAAATGWKDSRNDPSKAITHGDGTPLDQQAVQRAVDLAEQFTVDVDWQPGDVALVDNYVVMHGRRTFEGRRRVLASLVAAE